VIAANFAARSAWRRSLRVRSVASSSGACPQDWTGSRQENESKQQSKTGSDSIRAEKFLKKRGQLIKRVKNFQPHENERCDHQIKTKMHAGLETNASRGLCLICARP
jgi:hypothetical protein